MNEKTINEIDVSQFLAPIFWVLGTFGTREGYTKLLVWNMTINLVTVIALLIKGNPFFSIIPFGMIVLTGWVLNESYKTNRLRIDPLVSLIITILWTTSALTNLLGNSLFFLILFLLLSGSLVTIMTIWYWVLEHAKIEITHFLVAEEEHHETS